ncbi:DUF1566 domain-containing protein [Alteromonadaceae bacterium M269]|nr:DUF1566 domain-containing protein [Alteromonadaceae bacterium M269]
MRFCSFLVLSLLLTACGGGSGSDEQPTMPDVVVNAGVDQSVNEMATVSLGGEAAGGEGAITFAWTASPNDITITQDSTTASAASFVAPTVTEDIIYTLTLTATAANGANGSDTLQVTVLAVNSLPEAVVNIPQVSGQPANTFPAGTSVTLNGANSFDSDAVDANAPISAFRWEQTQGQDVLQNVSLDGPELTFVTPILADASTLGFTLTVVDGENAENSESVTLQILSESQTPPTVNAGVDRTVFEGETILLTGDASSVIPAANPLSFLWLNDSGLTPTILQPTSAITTAAAPTVTSSQTATFTLQVTDQFNNQVEDSIQVDVQPFTSNLLNDTGVTQLASNNSVGSEPQNLFPGQDGHRGRDVIFDNGALEKAGRGQQGFDYTRLDAVGDQVDDDSLSFSCVRDNLTGLVWEVKEQGASLNSVSNTYSWFFSENNGGFEGVANAAGASCDLAQCNTTAFVEAVNARGLCGFFDWRIPTYSELQSLLHLGKTSGPLIDEMNFPNTTDAAANPLFYWAREASADGPQGDAAQNAWAIDFATGNDNFLNKSSAARVRLVRAGR